MKYVFSGFMFLTTYSICIGQDLRIYHGLDGMNSVFLHEDDESTFRWSEPAEIVKAQDERVELVVVNPNPLLYEYTFSTNEIEIKDNFPEIGILVNSINSLPEFSKNSTKEDHSFHKSNRANDQTNTLGMYIEAIETIRLELSNISQWIRESDSPESKEQALNGVSAGYKELIHKIKNLPDSKGHFNSGNVKEYLDDLLIKAFEDNKNIDKAYSTDPDAQKAIFDSYKVLNQQIKQNIELIKESIKRPTTKRLLVPLNQKAVEVFLEVKKKPGYSFQNRSEFKQHICTIIPKYDRAEIELIPIVNLSYAANVPEYSVQGGSVVQGNHSGFKFSVGTMLIYNVKPFGDYDEGALGFGLGYNFSNKGVWESLYFGSLLSYRNDFRIGLGIGFNAYPSGLVNGASVGNPLPSDIANLKDVVDYKSTLSGFITFSFSGISILKTD